jgi:peptidoglycan/xylan/chitin deacetylase (PgdA/CDA1 family)
MRKIFFSILFFLQIHRLTRFVLRNSVVILVYHGFTNNKSPHGIANYDGLHHDVDRFKTELQYLAKNYKVISLADLVYCYSRQSRLPQRLAVITFDDGYESNYSLAFPLLRELQLPATIFVATNFVGQSEFQWTDRLEHSVNATSQKSVRFGILDQTFEYDLSTTASKRTFIVDLKSKLKELPPKLREEVVSDVESLLGQKLSIQDAPSIYRPLDWTQCVEMNQSGLISFGSHTCAHSILTRCQDDEIRTELSMSKKVIEHSVRTQCTVFCYPNGTVGDFDDRTKTIVQKTGYICGITNVHGFNDSTADVFELKRVGFNNDTDLIEFIMTLSGIVKLFSDIKQKILKLLVRIKLLNPCEKNGSARKVSARERLGAAEIHAKS